MMMIYLSGVLFVWLIFSFALHYEWRKGEDINLNLIITLFFLSFLSWISFVFIIAFILDEFGDKIVIRGKDNK